jgi:hypothetical protein
MDASGDTAVSTQHLTEISPQQYDVHSWFHQYDRIRKHARMSLKEKFQSRHLLVLAFDPFAIFSSEAEPLLNRMISKYNQAIEQMEELPSLPETTALQDGYLRYFKEAKQLFSYICAAQREPLAERHRSLHKLIERKKQLEILDQGNKELDARLRKKYDIPPLRN